MLFNDCFFFSDNIGVNAMYITVKKLNTTKLIREGREKKVVSNLTGNHVLKSEASIILSLLMHFLKTFCPQ